MRENFIYKKDPLVIGGDIILAAKPKRARATKGPDKKTGLSKEELVKLAKEKDKK